MRELTPLNQTPEPLDDFLLVFSSIQLASFNPHCCASHGENLAFIDFASSPIMIMWESGHLQDLTAS